MRLFNSFEALIKPNQSSWENQLTIPISTLENLHTQRQSDSKKKCLILKNVCDDSQLFTIFSVIFMIFWVHKQV